MEWRKWKDMAPVEAEIVADAVETPQKEEDLELEEPRKMHSLRPYQRDAVQAVQEAVPLNCCVVLPCGAGKTRVGAGIASDFLARHANSCVVVLCLRREGIRQWARELRENWGIEAHAAGGPPEGLRASQVILVTYHRMLSERRRGQTQISWEEDGIGEALVAQNPLRTRLNTLI